MLQEDTLNTPSNVRTVVNKLNATSSGPPPPASRITNSESRNTRKVKISPPLSSEIVNDNNNTERQNHPIDLSPALPDCIGNDNCSSNEDGVTYRGSLFSVIIICMTLIEVAFFIGTLEPEGVCELEGATFIEYLSSTFEDSYALHLQQDIKIIEPHEALSKATDISAPTLYWLEKERLFSVYTWKGTRSFYPLCSAHFTVATNRYLTTGVREDGSLLPCAIDSDLSRNVPKTHMNGYIHLNMCVLALPYSLRSLVELPRKREDYAVLLDQVEIDTSWMNDEATEDQCSSQESLLVNNNTHRPRLMFRKDRKGWTTLVKNDAPEWDDIILMEQPVHCEGRSRGIAWRFGTGSLRLKVAGAIYPNQSVSSKQPSSYQFKNRLPESNETFVILIDSGHFTVIGGSVMQRIPMFSISKESFLHDGAFYWGLRSYLYEISVLKLSPNYPRELQDEILAWC